MRWSGFRKVRAQVCKRIERRIRQLNIDGALAYRAYLEEHAASYSSIKALPEAWRRQTFLEQDGC
jgi:chemotaxis protein methyltransferase CheR